MSELGQPPLICPECIEAGPYNEYEGHQIWFCPHDAIYAVTREDLSGWYLMTGVTLNEFEAEMKETEEELRALALKTLAEMN